MHDQRSGLFYTLPFLSLLPILKMKKKLAHSYFEQDKDSLSNIGMLCTCSDKFFLIPRNGILITFVSKFYFAFNKALAMWIDFFLCPEVPGFIHSMLSR